MEVVNVFGSVQRIEDPKSFFEFGSNEFTELVEVVRSAFGRKLELEDIYQHVTSPERVYLMKKDGRTCAMASYNQKIFSGISSLVVEGVAIAPEFQGKGIFKELTDRVLGEEKLICLRTQNPLMYKALENYCVNVFPRETKIPRIISEVSKDFANYLGCEINVEGVVKGYYGGLFYGKTPKHKDVTGLFEKLNVQLNNGDALLVIGMI
ncbi:MAG: hypothetical protein AABX88_01060 [Nanoarchaeota archaeon]